MTPQPEFIRSDYRGSGKLRDKVAVITGGDSGIGRAVAVHFAREGAKVVIGYLEEDKDAEDSRKLVEAEGQPCRLFRGDLGDAALCQKLADEALDSFGRIDVLVNNGAEQHAVDTLEESLLHHRPSDTSERRLCRQRIEVLIVNRPDRQHKGEKVSWQRAKNF